MSDTITILGWDAASSHKDNGFCLLSLTKNNIKVEIKDWNVDNLPPEVNFLMLDLICIDIPLGWPLSFQNNWHSEFPPANQNAFDGFDRTFKRATDRFIKATTKAQVLEIGADKIARAALQTIHRLNQLLPSWKNYLITDVPELDPQLPKILEVYPKATIENIRVGDEYPTKDSDNGMISIEYVTQVLTDIEKQGILRFHIPDLLKIFSTSGNKINGHQFDAFIAAITGLMIYQGHDDYEFIGSQQFHKVLSMSNDSKFVIDKGYYNYITSDDLREAHKEGWIWVPYKK